MAQTISVSKTNTAMSFNGSTQYTLFTLASGTASRVIMNTLAFYRDDATTGTFYTQINVYNATTGNVPVGLSFGVGGSTDAMAFLVGNMAGVSATGPYGTGNLYPNTMIYKSGASSAVGMGDRTPSQCSLDVPTASNYGIYMPPQFWMCNGDSLKVKTNWGGTGACQASFTIITES